MLALSLSLFPLSLFGSYLQMYYYWKQCLASIPIHIGRLPDCRLRRRRSPIGGGVGGARALTPSSQIGSFRHAMEMEMYRARARAK